MSSLILIYTVVALLASSNFVDSHGTMFIPAPVILKDQNDKTEPCACINGSNVLPHRYGESYSDSPENNTKAFTHAFSDSVYETLRDFVNEKMVMTGIAQRECGYTDVTGVPQPLPDEYVVWGHGEDEGFTASHMGPCEVWCDEELVFRNENCAKNYPGNPAKLPIAVDKCRGKAILKFIWLALHSPQWQVYINCAVLERGSSYWTARETVTGGTINKENSDNAVTKEGENPDNAAKQPKEQMKEGSNFCPSHIDGIQVNWTDTSFRAEFETFFKLYTQGKR